MPESIVYVVAGPTQALDVTITAHVPVTVTTVQNEPSNYASFLNIGTSPMIVTVANVGQSISTVFPVEAGGPQLGFPVPALMHYPMLVRVPSGGFTMSAISNSATASTLLVTPMGDV